MVIELYTKYPRTLHLPWSEGISSDDKVLKDTSCFDERYVIVTEKLDGENTTFYRDHAHARSIDSGPHWSRNWVMNFWAAIKNDIPDGWRICGENMFATHSIQYNNLPSYFLGFSVWDENNICIPWQETEDFLSLLGITPVPVLYEGFFGAKEIQTFWKSSSGSSSFIKEFSLGSAEGYVVRVADYFSLYQFQGNVAKFVRKNHVQTDEHWMFGSEKKINKLAGG